MSAQPQEQTKYCPRCRTRLPVESFRRNRSQPDGLDNYCRTCKGEYERQRIPRLFEPAAPYFRGDERWDIDRLIARIEAANATDLANGGGIFTKRGEG